jgi:hypothetical protein
MGRSPRYEIIAQRDIEENLYKEKTRKNYAILKRINKLSNLDLLDLCFKNDEVRKAVSSTIYKSNPSCQSWRHIGDSWNSDVKIHGVLRKLLVLSDTFLDHEFNYPAIKKILQYEEDFVRPIDTWGPKSRNAHQQILSLIRHVFAKYPTPSFLEKYFMMGNVPNSEVLLYIHMGAGKSLKTFEGFPKWLSIPNRSLHHLYTTPDTMDFVTAIRRCQVLYMGGDQYIFYALMRANILRENLPITKADGETDYHPRHDEFWQSVMKFFIEHRMIVPTKIAEVIDYINNVKFVDGREMDENGIFVAVNPPHRNFSMKGRNPQTLIDHSDEWHYNRTRIQRVNQRLVNNNRYVSTTKLKDYSWTGINIRNCTITRGKDTKYQIIQLKTFFELRDEGSDMHHCVGTYASSCSSGKSTIFSIRQFIKNTFTQRMATIELRGFNLVQIRGKYNRKPDDVTLSIIKDWARGELLTISSYAI